MQKKPAPPFGMTYSSNLPELLDQLDCSLVLSTYQAGKVIIVSALDAERLVQLPRTFAHAMALGSDGTRLAVATQHAVVVLANAPGLAPGYPRQPSTYDALYAPRATYYTGQLDIHGLAWGPAGLWAVVTSFSCLALLDDQYSFRPQWQPPFITDRASGDQCHLNGLALRDGEPLYVTALGAGNEPQSWREGLPAGGVLLYVPSGETILADLPMPHSPRICGDALYLLHSATGELVCADVDAGRWETVTRIEGFVRGMAECGDYLFVGRSRLRKNSSTFRDLPIADKARVSGITVVHRPTGAVCAKLDYEASVDEIFDVQVLPGLRRPGIMSPEGDTTHSLALSTPEATFWAAAPKDGSTP